MLGKFKVRKDKVLVIDFEMTCWEGEPPVGQQPEIIEIGIVEIDIDALSILRSHSYLVKPELSDVSDYCEALTGHSGRKLKKQGQPLQQIASQLQKKWGTASKAWIAWGSDRKAIVDDCVAKGVHNPFSEAFHDLGQQFTFMTGSHSAVGLSKAMESLGLERSGRIHSGVDDALDTARTWIALTAFFREHFNMKLETSSVEEDALAGPNLR